MNVKRIIPIALFTLTTLCFTAEAQVGGITWNSLPGLATDVGLGGYYASGPLQWYKIGPINSMYGGSIFEWTDSNWWEIGGRAREVSVSPWGVAWVVNSEGKIFERSAQYGWIDRSGSVRAVDIGIGGNDMIWIAGQDGKVYVYLGGSYWEARPAPSDSDPVKRIDVDRDGKAWVVTRNGLIYQWSGWNWIGRSVRRWQVTRAYDIAIESVGENVYIVDREFEGEGYLQIWDIWNQRWARPIPFGSNEGIGSRIDADGGYLLMRDFRNATYLGWWE